MKASLFLTGLLVVLLTSCSGSSPSIEITPAGIKVEITRIVKITTTPVPTFTVTPAPTLDPVHAGATSIAEAIGTPIVASDDCFETALTQLEINSCANGRRQELEKQMADLLNALEEYYGLYSQEELEKFQSFQAEWEDFAKRECEFQSGMILVDDNGSLSYKGGSMSVTSYNECMVQKYEARLREFQIQLFNWTHQ
jgi:uncharacterized protein YecT (DUF1311 family)